VQILDYRRCSEPTAFVQRDFPIGTINAWSGSIATIPPTWRLCDGTHGTPDLRDKFVVGSGDTYSPADTGGNVNHNHAFTGDPHNHELAWFVPAIGSGANFDAFVSNEVSAGTTNTSSNLPTYYALAYIMYKGVI